MADWSELFQELNLQCSHERSLPTALHRARGFSGGRQALIKAFPASEATIRALPNVDSLVHDTGWVPPFRLWENTVILFTQLLVFIRLL